MCERSLLMRFQRHLSPVANFSSNRSVLGENDLTDTLWETILRKKRDRISAHEVEIINLHDLEVAYP